MNASPVYKRQLAEPWETINEQIILDAQIRKEIEFLVNESYTCIGCFSRAGRMIISAEKPCETFVRGDYPAENVQATLVDQQNLYWVIQITTVSTNNI